VTGQYADINGLHVYYEIHGEGRPLIALHRGLGSGEMSAPILDALTVPNQTHCSIVGSPLLAAATLAFLDQPADAGA
jgi:hypothetical protein